MISLPSTQNVTSIATLTDASRMPGPRVAELLRENWSWPTTRMAKGHSNAYIPPSEAFAKFQLAWHSRVRIGEACRE